MRRAVWLAMTYAAVVAGCGSIDTIEPRPSGQGGGATTATSSATTATTTSGGGSCETSDQCPGATWCAHQGCGGLGTCIPFPTGCDDDCPGVCGCDGTTYCNTCYAASAGIDVAHEGPCEESRYRAVGWFGGLDHLILMKANDLTGTCTRIFADAPTTGPYAVDMPAPWAVSQIIVGSLDDDCLDETALLSEGPTVDDASGTITWEGTPVIPCELTADLEIGFGDPVVHEAFQATLPVDGCM